MQNLSGSIEWYFAFVLHLLFSIPCQPVKGHFSSHAVLVAMRHATAKLWGSVRLVLKLYTSSLLHVCRPADARLDESSAALRSLPAV
jgi:hypothetical protein